MNTIVPRRTGSTIQRQPDAPPKWMAKPLASSPTNCLRFARPGGCRPLRGRGWDYEDVALGRGLHGPSEIAAFVEEATRASSDFRFEEVSLFTAGRDYASEWVMTGTNDREVQGVPATGGSFRVRGASVAKLDARGRIVENRDYYNLAEMFVQLGISPSAPSQAAPARSSLTESGGKQKES